MSRSTATGLRSRSRVVHTLMGVSGGYGALLTRIPVVQLDEYVVLRELVDQLPGESIGRDPQGRIPAGGLAADEQVSQRPSLDRLDGDRVRQARLDRLPRRSIGRTCSQPRT